MRVGSLFSGIGGLDLGLERAGMTVAWQAEVDPYCCRVLAKYWPDVPNLGDVTTIDWKDVPRVDLICGGYPCQPFSFAGVRRGEADPRHLWPHMRDAVRVLRPRFVLIENVAGHLGLGFDSVLADLGFDAEWSLVRACSVGAPHVRRRLFCVAYAPDDDGARAGATAATWQGGRSAARGSRGGEGEPGRWLPEPSVGRVVDGVPNGVVRAPLEALGNAVVPQVAEWIGRRVMASLQELPA